MSTPAGARPSRRPDTLGLLLCAAGGAALLFLPFVLLKANRILPGEPRRLGAVLPLAELLAVTGALAAAGLCALLARQPLLRLAAALAGLATAILALAAAADALTPAGNHVVRIAPGAGFWLLATALVLLATDALTRLRPGPALRVLALLGALAGIALLLAGHLLDNVSIMREYAVNAPRFALESRRHVALAAGSLAAALVAGLPLGVLCYRSASLRPPVLAALNLVQTIPSIALFGILMVPLGALAAAIPALGEFGVRGIGAAPAAVALFLYSLLPIVANTIAGLQRVPRDTIEAARGMGMTARQILASIEVPLALPVLLTGVRIVLVQNIGLVTVAALIGGGGLGTFVFQGIGQTAMDLVLLGAIPIVTLALAAAVLLDALAESLGKPA